MTADLVPFMRGRNHVSTPNTPARTAQASVVEELLKNPSVVSAIAAALGSLLAGIVRKVSGGGSRPPAVPVTEPAPAPAQPDPRFPDDMHPVPKKARRVTEVRLKLARAQYQRARHPEMYTPENPMGLYPNAQLHRLQAGIDALNIGSKFWLDLTAYDQDGQEFLPDAVIAYGLAFETEHHCGNAWIRGNGADEQGEPKNHDGQDGDGISNGITAWRSTLGFLHQLKAHGEGQYMCRGRVGDVWSNEFTIRVS